MPNLNNVQGCTLDTCPIKYATVTYDPSLEGNALFLGIFTFFLFTQIFQLWKYRTWSFSFAMVMGFLLEVLGYVGRVQMHYNPFLPDPFLLYLICLTIGPVFFAAALYLTYSRVLLHYGTQYSRFSPKTVSLTFMSCDFIALLLQATGGAIADTAPTEKGSMAGTHTMVAGLAFQVLSLLVFIALAIEFMFKVQNSNRAGASGSSTPSHNDRKAAKFTSHSFKYFITAYVIATICILTRSIFRVAELSKGFGSKLANEEIPFMILEGAMIVISTGLMTAAHPGMMFGEKWKNAGWKWGMGKGKGGDIEGEGAFVEIETATIEGK